VIDAKTKKSAANKLPVFPGIYRNITTTGINMSLIMLRVFGKFIGVFYCQEKNPLLFSHAGKKLLKCAL